MSPEGLDRLRDGGIFITNDMKGLGMEKTLKERENDILQRFEKIYKSEISYDGLHFLGDIFIKDGCWGRMEGNEEEMWFKACARRKGLVIITKELNDPGNPWDIRLETARRNFVEPAVPSGILFYKNLRNWVYCLLNIDGRGKTPDCPSVEVAQEWFENSPMVRINIKKSPGEGSTKYKSLSRIYEDKNMHSLLKEQLELYKDASIYLDCTRKWGIAYLMELYPDLRSFGDGDDEWIYYSEENKFIVINSYHPSYRLLNGDYADEYYRKMQFAIRCFFKDKPNFLR